MNTIHTVAALAFSLLGAASVVAADTPAAPASAPAPQADSKPVLLASAPTTATGAAAATTVAATAVAATAAATAAVAVKPAGRTREEVRAEAAEAVRNHRSTMSQYFDLLK